MKRVYWRPQQVSKLTLFAISLAAVGGTLAIEHLPLAPAASDGQTKILAAQLAHRGMHAIREARLAKGHEIDTQFDPGESGMIGSAMSMVTSLPGHLDAKQTSVNPNFAAVAVDMLQRAGVDEGDLVAVGCTGSFPALNTCLFTAIEALDAEPIVIHSAASSQFGANDPQMMWLDMHRVLYQAGIVSFHTHAATLGGFGDRARGMSDESKALLIASIDRNGLQPTYVRTLEESIERRMNLYAQAAAGRPIKAYVNVGGGAASIHGSQGRKLFGGGLAEDLPTNGDAADCVAARYAQQGVPVINLGNATSLAKRYGLPIAPTTVPEVGTGSVYAAAGPSRALAALLLVGVLITVRGYVWTDWWPRALRRLWAAASADADAPGPRLHQSRPAAELMV